MGETTMGPKKSEDQTYAVQVEEAETPLDGKGEASGPPEYVWRDVATVTVPARTHRKTVVEKALKDAVIEPPAGEQLRVRVLDADSARPFTVGVVQPPPQLHIDDSESTR